MNETLNCSWPTDTGSANWLFPEAQWCGSCPTKDQEIHDLKREKERLLKIIENLTGNAKL